MRLRVHYGWLVAVVMFLCFMLSVGIVQYSFGVFVTELETEFGWSRTQVNASLSLFAVTGLLAPPIGWLLDRFGSKPVMVISIAALALSQLLRPWMTDLWHFYALNFVQYAAFPGAIMIPSGKLIGLWFEGSRGRAMGLTAMGANFGGFVFAWLTDVLVGTIDWRATYFVYGVLFALLIVPVLLFIKDGPTVLVTVSSSDEAPGPRRSADQGGLSASEAIRTRAFLLIVVALFLATFTYQSVLTQIVPHLENIGVSRAQAAIALSFISLAGMGGKVLFGALTEVFPARYAIGASLACQIVGIVILVTVGTSSPLLWVFVPIFGLGFGGLGSLMPLVVQNTFGLRGFGSIFGLVNFFILGAALVGPPLVGLSFDTWGSYSQAFLILSGAFALGAIVMAFAKPPRTGQPTTRLEAAAEARR